MHPTITYELAQARIADLRREAQRHELARAAAHAPSSAAQPNRKRLRLSLPFWPGHRRRARAGLAA
jgi:hypothetical protein